MRILYSHIPNFCNLRGPYQRHTPLTVGVMMSTTRMFLQGKRSPVALLLLLLALVRTAPTVMGTLTQCSDFNNNVKRCAEQQSTPTLHCNNGATQDGASIGRDLLTALPTHDGQPNDAITKLSVHLPTIVNLKCGLSVGFKLRFPDL